MINRNEAVSQNQLLKACQDEESMLLSDLLRLLDQPSSEHTRQSLLAVLDCLLASLPYHLELACLDGYLQEVVRLRPNWHRQVEALHGANIWCISELRDLRDNIDDEQSSATIDTKESGDIDDWIRSLVSIRGQESRLLQTAFTLDIGGES